MPLKPINPTADACLCIFIYGPNGIGKTHLAATSPGKKLFLNDNGNWETLFKFPKAEWDVVEFPKKWKDMVSMWSDPLLDQYDVLVMDNITGVARTLLMDAVTFIPADKAGRVSPESPGLRDYALASERLKSLMAAFKERRSKQHVIAIGHERIDKDDVTGAQTYGPAAPGSVPAHILSLFTEFIYLNKDQGKRTAFLSQRVNWPAGTRLLSVDKVENPDLSKMYDKQFRWGPTGVTLFGPQVSQGGTQ